MKDDSLNSVVENRFYKIGDVSRMLGIPIHTIRYLEHKLNFSTTRTTKRHRIYSSDDIKRLRKVIELRKDYTLTGVKKVIRKTDPQPYASITPPILDSSLKEQKEVMLELLKRIKVELESIIKEAEKKFD